MKSEESPSLSREGWGGSLQRYNGGVHGEWTRWKNLGKGKILWMEVCYEKHL